MTDETVDCYNCGRANPEWAQVCRSCGVPLRHGEARVVPTGRIPTDQGSLISIAAVVGTILLAVVIGIFVSNLNPTDPSVGQGTPSPSVDPSAASSGEPSVAPSVDPSVAASAAPSAPAATPTPALAGTLAFGESIDGNGRIATPVDTFTPNMNFAYSVSVPGGFGEPQIWNEVVRLGEGDPVVVLEREAVTVDPAAETFGYVIGQAQIFISAWGPGEYEWRVYVGDEVVARGPFRLAEG
jgi:hypothetical protein